MIMEAESLSESRNQREEDSKSRQKVQRETGLIGELSKFSIITTHDLMVI